MMTSRSRLLFSASLVAGLVVASVGSLGCTGTSPYMAPAAHGAPEASEDAATVVFVRPSELGGADRVTIIDGKGRFLGETMPASYFATKVPAGEHLFISWGENTSAVKANVVAGKVYYVEVTAPNGPRTPFVYLQAATLRSPAYGKVESWLAKSKPLTPDEARGQADVQSRSSGVSRAIARGNKVLANYDASELAEHTLTPEDGK
jgi:hypothetical protein